MSTCLSARGSKRCDSPFGENRLTSSHRFALGSLEAASTAYRDPPSASVCSGLAALRTRGMRSTNTCHPTTSTSCTRARPFSGRSRLRDRALTRSPRTGEVSRPDASQGTLRFHDGLPASAGPSSLPSGCSPEVLDEDRPLTSLSPSRVGRAALSRERRSTSCRPSPSSPLGRENRAAETSQDAFHRWVPLLRHAGSRLRGVLAGASKSNHPRTSRRVAPSSRTLAGARVRFPARGGRRSTRLRSTTPCRFALARSPTPFGPRVFRPVFRRLRGGNRRGQS